MIKVISEGEVDDKLWETNDRDMQAREKKNTFQMDARDVIICRHFWNMVVEGNNTIQTFTRSHIPPKDWMFPE